MKLTEVTFPVRIRHRWWLRPVVRLIAPLPWRWQIAVWLVNRAYQWRIGNGRWQPMCDERRRFVLDDRYRVRLRTR